MPRINIVRIATLLLTLLYLPTTIAAPESGERPYVDPFIVDPFEQTKTSNTDEGKPDERWTEIARRTKEERRLSAITPRMYQCWLDHLQHVGSDYAARAIATACRELYRQ